MTGIPLSSQNGASGDGGLRLPRLLPGPYHSVFPFPCSTHARATENDDVRQQERALVRYSLCLSVSAAAGGGKAGVIPSTESCDVSSASCAGHPNPDVSLPQGTGDLSKLLQSHGGGATTREYWKSCWHL